MRSRAVLGIGIVALLAATGLALRLDRDPKGSSVRCLDSGRLCLGDEVRRGPTLEHDHPRLGRIEIAVCGFPIPPGEPAAAHHLTRAAFLAGACHSADYLAAFTDGARSKWVIVRDGRVAHLSNGPEHPFGG